MCERVGSVFRVASSMGAAQACYREGGVGNGARQAARVTGRITVTRTL
jgi:hypothetical protein